MNLKHSKQDEIPPKYICITKVCLHFDRQWEPVQSTSMHSNNKYLWSLHYLPKHCAWRSGDSIKQKRHCSCLHRAYSLISHHHYAVY